MTLITTQPLNHSTTPPHHLNTNMNRTLSNILPQIKDVKAASALLKGIINQTPLSQNLNYSEALASNIYFKREDLQIVRSYKIRGAYNIISSLSESQKSNGIVCASAGNHAQGVAYSCQKLGIKGTIFMPNTTPKQKIKQVEMFGKSFISIILEGDTYDDSYIQAIAECKSQNKTFVHPFNDPKGIEGQATVGLEILEDVEEKIDYLFLPVGGGGLASGVASIFKALSPDTKIIGVEPEGAASMNQAFEAGEVVELDTIDPFVDGAAVKKVGDVTYNICKEVLDEMITVPEGKICTTILKLYNEEAIVVEPAGALSIAALDFYKKELKGKNVVCVVSGSNNDITRTEEIKERSLLYEGLKHYFIIRFPQRAGALQEFLTEVLGEGDDIVHFEYSKKTSRSKGPALIGIELQKKENLQRLLDNLEKKNFVYEYLNDRQDLLQYLV